jgi:hypothetical protein
MGRSNRRHRRRIQRVAILFGILVSVLFGWLLFYLNRR